MQSQNHSHHHSAGGRGRGMAQRPASRKGNTSGGSTGLVPVRKIFNCICDDTALVAGVKKSTRNGIRQWVRNGQIRLFVPLNALEQLDGQRSGSSKHAEDVRETLQWLDEATSQFPHAITLQGGFETYEDWTEVEKFTVPKSLFSEQDTVDEDLGAVAESKLNISPGPRKESMSSTASGLSNALSSQQSIGSPASALSPPTSPAKAVASPVRYNPTTSETVSGGVPVIYRPLFNYILWRVHQEHDPIAALESFIFLCNDDKKVTHAKGFDIKTKRLEQLREAINREDRDYRHRLSLAGKTPQSVLNPTAPAVQPLNADGAVDASISRSPSLVPAEMVCQQTGMMDPDAFGREPQMLPSPPQTFAVPRSPRQSSFRAMQQSPRGNPAAVSNVPFHPRGGMRGGPMRGAGRGGTGRGRGTSQEPQGPVIDPNSFVRPRSGGFTGRGGAGQGRKLWVPS